MPTEMCFLNNLAQSIPSILHYVVEEVPCSQKTALAGYYHSTTGQRWRDYDKRFTPKRK
jgi:hypothetical protein